MALKWLIEGTPAQLNDLREIALKGKNSQTVAIASEGIVSPQNAVFAISNVIISGLYSDGIREFRLFTGPSNLRV